MRGILRAPLLALTVGTACSSAGGEIRGGELRPAIDASAPPPFVEHADASPTSWRGLYRDFFSDNATSGAGCGRTSCHGSAGKEGTLASNFLCANTRGCWDSMRNAKHPTTQRSLVEASAIADPASAEIFTRIRYRTGNPPVLVDNAMPAEPREFDFNDEAIERMKAWIRNGALND